MRGLHQSPSPVSPVPVASLHPLPWTTNSDLLCSRCVETCGSLRLLRVHGPTDQLNQRSDPKFTMRARHVQWHHSRPRHHCANDKHHVPKAIRASLDQFKRRPEIALLYTWPKIILFSSAIAASFSAASFFAASSIPWLSRMTSAGISHLRPFPHECLCFHPLSVELYPVR